MLKNNPPWKLELDKDLKFPYVSGFASSDTVIVGGGIAGCSTLYYILTQTDRNIILIEGKAMASGASGHNAGYVVADFEKPITELVREYGENMTEEALDEIENAWSLLDDISNKIGMKMPEKFYSVGAYCNLNRFKEDVLEQNLINDEDKMSNIFIRESSVWKNDLDINIYDKLTKISDLEFEQILNLSSNLENDKYQAIIKEKATVINSALLCQNIVKYCIENFKDRIIIYEHSKVNEIHILEEMVTVDTDSASINAKEIILCTNGFENFSLYNKDGQKINNEFHKSVYGVIGYMLGTVTEKEMQNKAGNFMNTNPHEPYIYYSSRKFLNTDKNILCLGGPEVELHERSIYKHDHEIDENIYKELEDFQKKNFNVSEEASHHWHGLMGYTKSGVRIVGRDKLEQDLYYNLGCNGIGILPSISGAYRIARLLNGEILPPSIFDPK